MAATPRLELVEVLVDVAEVRDQIKNVTPWPLCKAGHEQSPDNVTWAKCVDGKERARCRPCKTAAVARHRERQRGQDVPLLKAFSPRQGHAKQVEPPAAQTVSLFTVLPADFRQRLAGELMTRVANPLQLTYLKRASEERVWVGTSEDYAVALFIQGLIDLTVDAHSPLLRVDRLLAVVLRP